MRKLILGQETKTLNHAEGGTLLSGPQEILLSWVIEPRTFLWVRIVWLLSMKETFQLAGETSGWA
jgi:hypothetical protein